MSLRLSLPARLLLASIAATLCAAVPSARAQDAPSTSAALGGLTQFSNIDPKDTSGKLTLLQQELYQQELETSIIRFTLQYGSTVHIEPVMFPSTGLSTIPGYMFTPVNMPAGKKYPAIVFVHGGFHDRFESYFFKILATAVQKGYVAFFPDYRGSSGYGEVHYENSYGTTDVADVLAAADFLTRQPFIDATRLGIVGHSRGGMVTVLAIEQSRKFKVATEIAGLQDFVAYMSYKPNFRRDEVAKEPQFGGLGPDKNLPAYIKISPISHVKDIQTPLLVLANTFDETVPLDLHSGRLIDLLKADGKVYESHIYENAPGGHMFPWADTAEGKDVFERVFAWTGKYLNP